MDVEEYGKRFDHLVLRPRKRGVVVFECPVCRYRMRSDGEGLEPACTGPHPSLDEHPLTPMRRLDVDMERTR
jgi:hypothetical protein